MKNQRKILEIISEETRYEIINLLASSGRYLTVSEISERIGKDKKTIDKHLRILLENELVSRKYLEDENAYGYSLTDFCSFLISSIEKIFSSQKPIEIEMDEKEIEIKTYKGLKNVFEILKFSLGFLLIIIGLIIGWGANIGLIPKGNEPIKLFGMLIFLFLAIIYFKYIFKRK